MARKRLELEVGKEWAGNKRQPKEKRRIIYNNGIKWKLNNNMISWANGFLMEKDSWNMKSFFFCDENSLFDFLLLLLVFCIKWRTKKFSIVRKAMKGRIASPRKLLTLSANSNAGNVMKIEFNLLIISGFAFLAFVSRWVRCITASTDKSKQEQKRRMHWQSRGTQTHITSACFIHGRQSLTMEQVLRQSTRWILIENMKHVHEN